ncbi:DNA repair protein RecO [Candidatus Acetothermia bacterium]|jgi:DNA repair protein RecO (recombination protein O)|nr:DNA repair protein RecO [Candidatus Acetothermia bacterium]MCI2431746.1 DNA repair protein RecO [Candidatus Acetothermia bacterium]MCI2435777.1 DNA repair protein RecO [Candidatus Acetothermia bacterium]
MIRKTTGIILRAIKFRESDLILTALSRDYGKISLIAKAARRPESKFGAALDLLTLSELVFYEGENLKLLKEASIVADFRKVKREYERLETALQAASLLNQLIEDEHPDRAVFDLYEDFLSHLDYLKRPSMGELAFKLKLLRAAGLAPRLNRCARGGHLLTRELWFSAQHGGLVCSECHQAGDTRLQPGTAQSLKMLLGASWERLDRLALYEDELEIAHRLIDEFIGYHLRAVRR